MARQLVLEPGSSSYTLTAVSPPGFGDLYAVLRVPKAQTQMFPDLLKAQDQNSHLLLLVKASPVSWYLCEMAQAPSSPLACFLLGLFLPILTDLFLQMDLTVNLSGSRNKEKAVFLLALL